ncbi:MAG: C40 family peptidase [Pseudomonadota bacterium]
MDSLDPRLHPHRPDLAAAYLTGRVEAARFAEGQHRRVKQGIASLRARPEPSAPLVSQLLAGETVAVYEEADGWAWLQCETDGYVGYMRHEALSAELQTPSHAIAVLRTPLLPSPDLKTPAIDFLHLTSGVQVIGEEGNYSQLVGGGWVYSRHLAALDQLAPDYVETALTFLGTPYLWGGRSSLGLDCSALVQLALARAGIACQRDSDQQEATIGEIGDPDAAPRRGDLIYLPGHVAIALDERQVVHANAYHMLVTIEPLADLVARVLQESGRGITGLRRP